MASAAGWALQATESFWLDEAGTAWVVQEGSAEAVQRSEFQGQTPFYYLIAWGARALLGTSEIALRAPSLLGAALAAFLIYRLGRRLLDPQAGLLAAIVFGTMGTVVFSATNARPYALALATATASMLALIRWFEEGRPRHAIAWAVSTAATIWLTYMFGLLLIPQGIYMMLQLRREPARARGLALAAGGMVVLLAPAVPQALRLLTQDDLLVWAREGVSPRRLMTTLVPPLVVAAVVFGAVAGRLQGRLRFRRPAIDRAHLVLILAWAAVPPVAFFLAGWLGSGKLFQARYYLSASPGIALAVGWLIRGFRPARAQAVCAGALVLLAVLTYDDTRQGRQDWRGAAHTVNRVVEDADTPVLLHTGFATRRSQGPGAELVLAPAIAYPMEGELIPLPFDLRPDTIDRMRQIAQRAQRSDRFVLVQSFDVAPFREWLGQRLQGEGYSVTTVFQTANLQVDVFDRQPTR